MQRKGMIALLLLILAVGLTAPSTGSAEVVTSLEAGKTMAAETSLPLVLDFGAKW